MHIKYFNKFPLEISYIIFKYLIIHLDIKILMYISSINKKYEKIIMDNVDIRNLKNVYEEKEYKEITIEGYYKNNLDYLIKNVIFLLKKNNNEIIYICFFDNFLKENYYNDDSFEKLLKYFFMNEYWPKIKSVYLLSLQNSEITNKQFKESLEIEKIEESKFFKL